MENNMIDRKQIEKLHDRFIEMAKVREQIAEKSESKYAVLAAYGRAESYRRCASELEAVLNGHEVPDVGTQFEAAEKIFEEMK